MQKTAHRSARALLVLAGLPISALALSPEADGPTHAGMLRYPAISATHIAFCYANDLWTVPRDGGVASPLASPPGQESYTRFSPDGKTIAFVGNYDGNRDIYTIPMAGGLPTRVTFHPAPETISDWAPSGKIVFFSNAVAGLARQQQLFTVDPSGAMPEALPVPYGANGVINRTGEWLAYTPHSTDTRTWKRYRGGMATDIWLFNLKTKESRKVTDWEGTDTLPMWHEQVLFYVSDAGPEHRLNIWAYDTGTSARTQITKFADYDVKWPSIGPGAKGQGEIVFQLGADLMVLDLSNSTSRAVNVTIPGARPTIRPRTIDVASSISGWSLSPTAHRAAVEARGDLWTLPAEKGSPRNLTHTSGIAERDPSWSPDGQWIAYFSDATGEYELYVMQSDGKGETRQLTKNATCYRYNPTWSPDSKMIAFTNKAGEVWLHTIASSETKKVDADPGGNPVGINWSHDSRWIAYAMEEPDSKQSALWVYEVESGKPHRLTSGMFSDGSPVFDRKGEYLYFSSNRIFRAIYSDIDTSFVYTGTQTLLALPLRADVKSPYLPTSDEESSWKDKDKDKKKDDKKEDKKDDAKKDDAKKDEDKKDDKKDDKGAEKKDAKADDGVSGTWTGNATGPAPLPPEGIALTINVRLGADNAATGSLVSVMGTINFTGKYDPAAKQLTLNATIDGDNVTFVLKIDGQKMTGTATHGPNSFQIKADRTEAAGGEKGKADDKKDDKKDEKKEPLKIDFDGIERRAIPLAVKPGSFGRLAVNDKNQLIFARMGAPGADQPAAIKLFDLKDDKKEEKEVASGAGNFELSADGKKIIIVRGNGATIQDASAGSSGSGKAVPTSGMRTTIEPREEWKQILTEVWRLERDFFYVKNMHNVDWAGALKTYQKMLEDATTREDVAYITAEFISELNIGHAYVTNPGDVESSPTVPVGLLGCDFELVKDGGASAYRIASIIEGAPWDSDARGPLSQPGVDAKVGDYLLAVNGVPVDTSKAVWAAFQGLTGRNVTLTLSQSPTKDDKAREVVVDTVGNETNLRYRRFIEQKRKYVEEKTGGKVGYIYVPNTGLDGQTDLFRQFYGQIGKQALIIDERWNGGGQIPTRFIELLNRPATNAWARRDGKDDIWPPDSHQGPKCMLINGLAGSGGDMFPALFKQAKLGKLIGARTWGGLVGISGGPQLIDGGAVSVPSFGFYKLNGTWGIEGHGVDPDVPVVDDPSLMQNGGDPQLDKAIELMLAEVGAHPWTPPKRPADPDRKGMGILEQDK